MKRRLYFLFPTAGDARRLVRELAAAGVDEGHIHALARTDIDLSGLPPATRRQQHDTVWRLEQALWGSNLAVFGAALLGLVVALILGLAAWALLAVTLMAASFSAGAAFALRVPNTHLDECREALRHGEVLLMVDVPRRKVAEIEELVYRRHPEAIAGGVGWTLDAFGL